MSDIWRWPAPKLKMAIRLRRRTTISTPSITSDRCSRALTRARRHSPAGLRPRNRRRQAPLRRVSDHTQRRMTIARRRLSPISRPCRNCDGPRSAGRWFPLQTASALDRTLAAGDACLDPTLQCDYSGGQASKVASPSSMSAFSATARWALSSSAERLKLSRLEAVALA
jgi:hypothetical protein